MKLLSAQINPTVGDLSGNVAKILAALARGQKGGAHLVLFPELCITGYPPEDLLLDPSFIEAALAQLSFIAPATKGLFVAVGVPRWNPSQKEKPLYNSAAIFIDGKLVGYRDKTLLPTYDVFDERRYFEPGDEEQPTWTYRGKKIGVTICEDLWEHADQVGYTHYRIDPVLNLKKQKVDLVLNLSASPYSFERKDLRISVFEAAAKTLQCPVLLCNQVGANDQLIFDGNSLFVNEKGEPIALAKGFQEEDLWVDLEEQRAPCKVAHHGVSELYTALVLGVRDYFHKQGFKKAVVGVSGGIDSALTTVIAVDALGAPNVQALFMPTRYSSQESRKDAETLCAHLKISFQTIEIDPLFEAYRQLLLPLFGKLANLTEQNLQARIRAMILMAFSNQTGALLLTTGNKSEMAMGYTTLYGDMAGGLGVLQDLLKLQVYELAHHVNRHREIIPPSILTKAPSPELRAGQKTTEDLFPFEILDPSLKEFIEKNGGEDPLKIAEKVYRAEYKRRQAPIGLRVSPKAFSKGRNIPIVHKWQSAT